MPWVVEWIDKELHIYDSAIRDPFTESDLVDFYEAWFEFVESGPSPLYALFDISEWGGGMSILDERFARMGHYKDKIRVIAMVGGRGQTAVLLARIGASVLGRPDWFEFFDTRADALAYLRERAAADLGQSSRS